MAVPVCDASYMQFGIKFFCYQFLVTNSTMLYFRAGLCTSFPARFSVPISSMCVIGMSVTNQAQTSQKDAR